MEFHQTFTKYSESGDVIDYGVFFGNEKIVFIKSGRSGSERGYEDKYVQIARRCYSNYGCTVICASNPLNCKVSYDIDMIMIEEFAKEKGFSSFDLYLIGSSNGAYQNLFLANRLPQTKELLCINMPLMLNFHKAMKEIQTMDHIEKTFVYGSKDPSYSFVPFLEIKKFSSLRIIRVEGADHEFENRMQDFLALADFISV